MKTFDKIINWILNLFTKNVKAVNSLEMNRFTIRIELHKKNNYAPFYTEMTESGFTDFFVNKRNEVFNLLDGDYFYEGESVTIQAVSKKIKDIFKKLKINGSFIITESKKRVYYNLTKLELDEETID